jgi:hypothetical protein
VLWIGLAAALAAAATWVYLVRERLKATGIGLSLLRTVALAATAGLIVNATAGRVVTSASPTVALDASLSMQASATPWRQALDTAIALAGTRGRLVRFGDAVAPFDSSPPSAGRSVIGDVLRLATARGGPAVIVTDGELDDFVLQPAELRARAEIVLLPRAPGPGLALTDAAVPTRVLATDSLPITIEIATWGGLEDSTAALEIATNQRQLARRVVVLPRGGARVRRTVTLAPTLLSVGTHPLELTVSASGDPEQRDNTRVRIVTVSTVPAVVLIASPPDWATRFLSRELRDIAPGGVLAFGEVVPGRWIDMETQKAVSAARVQDAARTAGAVVARGQTGGLTSGRAVWRWAGGTTDAVTPSDWYVASDPPASPLLGRLAGITWDSLAPLSGIPTTTAPSGVAVLTARAGRRGPARPFLVAREDSGRRELVTAADGLWRWAFRGGASREAYRAVLAAGVEWLLAARSVRGGSLLDATAVVSRGVPVTFRWAGDSVPPGPVPVELTGPDSTFATALTFDASGAADVHLPVGVYRWRAPSARASGVVAVESYSDEFVPRTVVPARAAQVRVAGSPVGLRDLWWVFVVAMLAFLGEWAWRTRRGLP